MRALLLKDCDVLQRGSRVYLILTALLALIPLPGFVGFVLIYASMLPYQAFAYDERSKWDTLAAMMPYSPRALVASKYALGWIGIGSIALLAAASRLVQLAAGRAEALEDLISILPIASIGLLILAVTLPLVCRFGVEKGRLLFMGIIAVAAVGLVSGISALDGLQLDDSTVMATLFVLTAVSILAQPLSILIAEKLYRRRFYEGAGA